MTTDETIALNALTVQTAALLETCTAIKAGVTAQIAAAVATSTNAALIPLVILTRNQVDMSALVITLITQR